MRDNVIWGLYIITLHVLRRPVGRRPDRGLGRPAVRRRALAPIVRLAVVEATVTIATAALLHHPRPGPSCSTSYNLFIHAHWLSPMIWDVTVILIYLVLSLLYLWLYMRRDLAARGSWLALGTKDTGEAAATATTS